MSTADAVTNTRTKVEVIPRELTPKEGTFPAPPLQPRDEWERRLLSIATDCGVSLSNEAVSSEGLYE